MLILIDAIEWTSKERGFRAVILLWPLAMMCVVLV